MANNQSTFVLKLETKGMPEAQRSSKEIRENLEGAQKAASATKVARSAAAQPTGMAGVSAGIGGREVEEYNRAAGAAGKAGGTARDFADQARGLGGLVRLYATVAANAFAAAAAFGALSRAMDTTNMVKGLDQLGAASGVALGSLSKRLVSATDGAVSLREAMEATVKASSAGLNTDQILQLGDVSKKAAQALGLNMTDALSRLTRGITKLEPELLDELGIFVKIDDATSKYALSVGKSVSALTDFEKRQAFANAVLEQGKRKFDEIKIDSNPYAKLAASFQNLTYSVLDFVNKGLGPIAKLLSENSAILAGALAFIALKLTQAALPALGQWQQGLVTAAKTAKDTARSINTSFGEAFVQRWTDKLRIPELQKQVEEGKKSLQSLGSMVNLQGMGKGKAALTRVLAGGTEAKDIKTLNNLLGEQTKKYEEALEANNKRQNATTRALQAEISFYQTAIDRSKALAATTRELTEANKQFNKSAVEAPSGMGERAREMIAKSADRKAQMYSALADVNKNVLEQGIGDALKTLNKQLNVEGVGYIRRFTGLAIGAFSAVTTSIGIFASAVQGYFAIFSFIVGIGAALLTFFSNTKKETEATSESFSRLEGGLKTTRDTLERISMMKDPLEKISVESVQAKANALKELGDSSVLAQKRAFDEIAKMNMGDKVINWFKGFLDADVQTKLSSNITESITQSLKLAEEGPAKEQAKKTLEAILGFEANSKKLAGKISTLVQAGDREKIAKITEVIQQLGMQSSVSAAKGTEFKESIKKLTTDIQEFNKSLTPGDAISKFAQDATESAKKLKIALDDPTQSLQAMINASGDINLLAIFPPEVATVLMGYNSNLKTLATSLENVSELAPQTKQEINALQKELDYLSSPSARRDKGIPEGESKQTEQSKQAKLELDRQIAETKKKLEDLKLPSLKLKAEIEGDVSKIKSSFDSAVRSSLIKSSEMMGARIAAEVSKAQTAVLSTIAGMLGDTEVGIKLRTEIELKSIDASNAVARESANLAMEVDKLRIQMEKNNLVEEKKQLGTGDRSEETSTRKTQIETRLKELTRAEDVYRTGPGALTSKGLRGQLEKGKDVSPDLLQAVQKFESLNAAGASAAAQKESVRIKERIDLLVAAQKKEMEILDVKIKQGSISISSLNTQKEMGLISDEEYARKSNILALQQVSNDFDKKRTEAEDEYNKLSAVGSELYKAGKKDLADQVEQLAKRKLAQAKALTDQEKQLALQEQEFKNAKNLIEIQQKKFDKATKEIEFRESLLKAEDDLAKIKVDSARQEIEYLANTDRVSKEYAANRIAEITRENQAINYQSQLREAAAQRDAAIRTALNTAAQEEIKSGGQDDGAAMIKANKEIENANKLYAVRTAAIEGSNISQTRAIELTRQQALETAKQNEELKKQAELLGLFESIVDTLAKAFGKTGDVLGKFVGTIGQIIDSQQTYNRERQKQSKIIDEVAAKADSGYLSPDDMAAMNKATEERGKLDRKNAKDEISNNAKILGSAKTLFKEKTAAYKILAGMEKAMHIARLVMDAKEMISNISKTGVSLIESGKRMFASGQEAVTAAFAAKPWPLGLIAGTAMIATIASIIGKAVGSGSAAPPAGFTAEEQQKVQGTGQFYREGKLVETGAGVLGDATAKSKSVENAIQNMEQYDFKNLEYNNKMLEALKGIRKNTENLAGNLLKSIPGLNIKPETIKSGNWLLGKDTTEVLDQGIKIIGTIGQIIDQSAQLFKYTNTKTTSSGFLGLFKDVSYNPQATRLQSGPLQRDLSLIFKDVGTALGEAAETLGMGTATQIMDGFRSIDLSEQFKQISLMDLKPDEMVEALMSVVSSGMDTAALQLMPSLDKFRKAGESFADTVLRVANDTRVVKLSFEELGLTLPKLVEEGARPTAEQLNRLTNAQSAYNAALAANNVERQVYVEESAYNNTGSMQTVRGTEESARALADALIELTSAQAAVTTAANSLTTRNLDLVQSYIDAAGGLDEFVERNRFFAEKFLTEAERLAPVQERVNKEIARLAPQLANLGITAGSNRDQFKQAVLAAQALGQSGVQLYNDLMKLAPAFDMVTQEAGSAALSVADFSKKVLSNEVDIIRMQANLLEKSGNFQAAYTKLQESVLISRQAELAELEKLPEAQKTVLKYQLEYKWSLEDLASQTENNIKINNQLISSQQSFIAYLDEAFGLLNQALRLRGEGIDAQGIERTIKLQELSAKYSGKENEVRLRVLTGLQKYVWALEDEETAKQAYVKALQTQAQALQREIAEIDKILDQRSTIDQLKALTAADKDQAQSRAKTLARERELLQIRNEYDKSVVGAIVANQVYINALEDEKELRDRLVEAHNREKDAIESTISTIKDAIKSIKDYRNSLIFSSELSVMTPEQQYKEARKIFEETLTAARTPGVDEAGTKAQQEALSKIPEVSNKFLELSRTLFASSGSYMTDYQVVQNALTMTEAALGEQLTEAEQQLAELKVISDALGLIEENTKTAAELFLEYGRAQAVSSAAATAASAADSRDTKDLDALRNSKLDELKTVNDKIRDLGERQLTSTEAATAATKAGSVYQAAVANTTKALNDISADVNNGTIRQAIEARQAATETITELRLANDHLNTILINTYANYQTQRQHFQNLMTNPQDVNVTGGAVTTILAAIAANTAKTADNVTNVQTAVSAGTNAVVRNNTATSDQTAAVVAEAVQTAARGSDWKAVTLPVVQSSGTVIAVTRER